MSTITQRFVLLAAWAFSIGAALAAEPPFTLTEDGSAFLYRARPGDNPGTVAAMFGIRPEDVPAFLAANGIGDATRIQTGQLFRIPNPLATRAERAENKAQALAREVGELRARNASADHDLSEARQHATAASDRADQLARFAWLYRVAVGIGALLAVGLGLSVAIASNAVRMRQRGEHYARTLADELEEKRRRGLAERQESAKHILDLEAHVQQLTAKVASLTASPGRRTQAG